MGQCERPFVVAGKNRLRIGEHRGAGGRVPRVTDRHVPGQSREDCLAKDVRHQPHPAVRTGNTSPVHRDRTGRFLATVLQAVEPEIGDTRCVRDARHTDDAAHLRSVSHASRNGAEIYVPQPCDRLFDLSVSQRDAEGPIRRAYGARPEQRDAELAGERLHGPLALP